MSSLELSPKIFIGRDVEVKRFKNMLDNPNDPRWILSLVGEGGQGKTQLLDKFTEIVQDRREKGEDILITAKPIDFYWTAHQRELGILDSLAAQLEITDEFKDFHAQLRAYQELLSTGVTDERIQYSASEARNIFLDHYQKLAKKKRIVLLFDTAELVANALSEFWQRVFPKLQTNTLAVIAGREHVSVLPEDQVVQLPIGGFSPNEVISYFNETEIDISEEQVAKVTELSKGKPILIALTIDWIRDGHAIGELMDYDPSEFEEATVTRVQRLGYPEDKVILAMAHLYRRFNEKILSHILDMSVEDAIQLIKNLSRFTFIKYRPTVEGKIGTCLLHDEMRDLVVKHVWTALDPLGEYRRDKYSKKIVGYYTEGIEKEADQLEWQNLSLEKFHYLFDIDPKQAFTFSRPLFERARESFDTGFMESINAEVHPYYRKLAEPMQQEVDFRTGIVLHRREKFAEAIKILDQLAQKLDSTLLKARTLAYLTEACADSGRSDQALKYGSQCEEICQSLLKQSKDTSEQEQINHVLALGYNNLGYTYRALGDLNRVIEYYEEVLKIHSKTRLASNFIARLRNNLAYVYFLQGDMEKALSLNKAAERIRLSLDIPYELGLNYNVQGMLYVAMDRHDEAIRAFKEAIRQFDRARSERGKGLVYIAYGRQLKRRGWFQETEDRVSVIDGVRRPSLTQDKDLDSEIQISRNENYQKAKYFLTEADRIFAKAGDLVNQSEALNELGCLYRQVEDWRKAEENLEQSVECAKQGGNKLRELDSLLDLAIVYYRAKDLSQAKDFAQQVRDRAQEGGLDYLFAKAQHLFAIIAFEEHDYDQAFEAAGDACVFVLKDPEKHRTYYQVVDSIADLILKLPSLELVKEKTDFLINHWQKANVEKEKEYSGFKLRMNSLVDDYLLLAEDSEEHK